MGDAHTGSGPCVALAFPPLVTSSFGHYYPSTAVLAGYLASIDIDVLQIDLNQEFSEYLLSGPVLHGIASGAYDWVAMESGSAAVARALMTPMENESDSSVAVLREASRGSYAKLKTLDRKSV